MSQHDDTAPAPDSLSGKLHDLFDEDDETSSDDTESDDTEGVDEEDGDGRAVDPLPKRPTDPPF